MFFKHYKIIIGLLVSLMLLVFFIIKKWPDEYVHIVFCDVGQGDATLIYHGFSQMLIDSGADDRVLKCLNDNLPFWDRSIELVVATHYDNDHIGGFEDVFDFYNVGSVLTLPFVGDSDDFESLKAILEKEVERGLVIKRPFLGQKISFSSGISFTIVSSFASKSENRPLWEESSFIPKVKTADENMNYTERGLSDVFFYDLNSDVGENDLSIALLLSIYNTKILLTGDLEEEGEKAMLQEGLTTRVNILKVGHHGSKTSSSMDFLQQLQPEVAIISCGKNNKYNHPDSQILDRLSELGVEVFRTDQVGEIEVVTNEENYWFAKK